MPKTLSQSNRNSGKRAIKRFREAVQKGRGAKAGLQSFKRSMNVQGVKPKDLAGKVTSSARNPTPARPRNASDVLGRKLNPGRAAGPKTSQAKPMAPKASIGLEAKKPSPRPKPAPKKSKSPASFKEAFAQARKKGVGTKFSYKGKSFVAVTKEDLQKAGHKSLRSFLNARRQKK